MWLVPSIIAGILGLVSLIFFYLVYREVLAKLKNRFFKPIWENPTGAPAYQVPEYRWQPPPKT